MKEIWPRIPSLERLLKKQTLSPGQSYRWSQFIVWSEDGKADDSSPASPLPETGQRMGLKACRLYNTLTLQYVEPEIIVHPDSRFTADQIQEDPELYSLMQNYFLVPGSRDETAFYLDLYRLHRLCARKPGYSGYTILPTWSCNARCSYCFEEGLPRTGMDEKTVEKTISFLLASRRKDTTLHLKWFGGEPLLASRVIDRICAGLENGKVPFTSVMTTNGSLITDAAAQRMAGSWHMKSVKVSMDCAGEEYFRRKNYYHYDDTYRRVMENVNRLMKRGIRVNIRCNVDEENMDDIPEFLADLSRIIEKKEELSVVFAPLHASLQSSTCRPLLRRLEQADRWIRENGFLPSRPRHAAGFCVNHCMADNPEGNVVIAPTGDLYACSFCEPGTSFGNVADGVTLPKILASYMEVGEVRQKCTDCPFLPRCTPFSRCPIREYYCREEQMRRTQEMLLKGKSRTGTD